MGRLASFAAVFLLFECACLGWNNDFDEFLHFNCDDESHAVTGIKSSHDNYHEDRRFDITCSPVESTPGSKSCYWTEYVNDYDEPIFFMCDKNHYINGLSSVHDNHREDRRWKFKCCPITDSVLNDCYLTGWTNDYDKDQDYSTPESHAVTGMFSGHDNHREDRRYQYMVCKYK